MAGHIVSIVKKEKVTNAGIPYTFSVLTQARIQTGSMLLPSARVGLPPINII